MRPMPLIAVLFATLAVAAGCAPAASMRVPEVVTARTVGSTAPAAFPITDTGTVAPGREPVAPPGEPGTAAREQTPRREVVAPHVDEREDEGDGDAAPEEERE